MATNGSYNILIKNADPLRNPLLSKSEADLASYFTDFELYTNPTAIIKCLAFCEKLAASQRRFPSKKIPVVASELTALAAIVSHSNPEEYYKNRVRYGQGCSGTVYRATVATTGEDAVIVVRSMDYSSPTSLNELCSELQYIKQVQHPNILKVLAVHLVCEFDSRDLWIGREISRCCLTEILEQYEHVKLTEPCIAYLCMYANDHCAQQFFFFFLLLASSSSSSSSFFFFLLRSYGLTRFHKGTGVLRALSFITSNRRRFTDIKSDNVLITARGEVKLDDFENYGGRRHSPVVGTSYWTSPEEILGIETPLPLSSDSWSVGIMVLEMTDGEPPYMEYPPARAMFLTVTQDSPWLTAETRNWSADFREFVRLCLQRRFDKRPDPDTLLSHRFLQKASDASELLAFAIAAEKCNHNYL